MCGTTLPPVIPPTAPNDIDNDFDGYTENQGDCNDNEKLEFPNQTWYKDLDNDEYSDGVIIVTCPRPINYKASSELYKLSGDINDSIPDPFLQHPPKIYNINPPLLLPNKTLVIKGEYFGAYQGSAFLFFANIARTPEIVSWNDTQITCLVPLGIQTGCLSVKTNMGISNCVQYEAKETSLPWLMLLLSEK